MISLKLMLLLLCVMSLIICQKAACYSTCKQFGCQISSPHICLLCDSGQVIVSSTCVSSDKKPQPITKWKVNQFGNLLVQNQTSISCKYQNRTTLHYVRSLGSLSIHEFNITGSHQFVRIKFNAIILDPNDDASIIYTIYDQSQNVIQIGNRSHVLQKAQLQAFGDVTCTDENRSDNSTVPFYMMSSFSSTTSKITLEIRSSNQASIGVSNIQVSWGLCHFSCATCFGALNSTCKECSGFFNTVRQGRCSLCLIGFYDGGGLCLRCPIRCLQCVILGKLRCLICQNQIGLPLNGTCDRSFQIIEQSKQAVFNITGWSSTQTHSTPQTLCGGYSLIGGFITGRGGSSLTKTFTQLQAHNTIRLMFTLFLIDQLPNSSYQYRINIDQQNSILQDFTINSTNGLLSQVCQGSNLEFLYLINRTISHKQQNLTFQLTGFKNYFGIRDFTIEIYNFSTIKNCYELQNGNCKSCRHGYMLNDKGCTQCPAQTYQYLNECIVCPAQCQRCQLNFIFRKPQCVQCHSPLVLDNGRCLDGGQLMYSSGILPQNYSDNWVIYPKIQQKGIDKCGNDSIIGSTEIKYRFIFMKKKYNNLPKHRGVRIHLHYYQIDDYSTQRKVYFKIDNKFYDYNVSNNKKQQCGNSTPDSIQKIYLNHQQHTNNELSLEVHIEDKLKFGVNNVKLFLLECQQCQNVVKFTMQNIPKYSIATPPQKGVLVKLTFNDEIKNLTLLRNIFQFQVALKNNNRRLQGLFQPLNQLPIAEEEFKHSKILKYGLALDDSYINQKLRTIPKLSNQAYTNNNGRLKPLSSNSIEQTLYRYMDISIVQSDHRSAIRNFGNFFGGCAVFALIVIIISYLFDMSKAFDDFFTLCQLLFLHVFISYSSNPPSWLLPISQMSIVQFIWWLPIQSRQFIEQGILPNNLYQNSPLIYEQFAQDIAFVRSIYLTVIFLFIVLAIFLILKIMQATFQSHSNRKMYKHGFLHKYYYYYQYYTFSYIEKVMRVVYITIVWSCALQFIQFNSQPKQFFIWNATLTIIFFVIAILYPALGFFYLFRRRNIISQNTFHEIYDDIRISSEKLYYFLFKYYKIFAQVILIALLWSVNPIATLIPILLLNVVHILLLIFLPPFSMIQSVKLNVCFFNHYPKAYYITTIIEQILFVVLEIFLLVLYGQSQVASDSIYVGLGYFCCVLAILLILNGFARLLWGFMKIVEGCYADHKETKVLVEKKVQEEALQPSQQRGFVQPINSSLYQTNNESRMKSLRKRTQVSKI